MMKRVGFSRFKPSDVTRKVQQCLRFEGVHANGDANADSDKCVEEQAECECKQVTTDENEPTCEDHRNKSNILNTIRKKWRKSKRNKRCDIRGRADALANVCQCHSGNCEIRTCCTKHYRTRKLKSGEKNSVWPLTSSILRCQNHQERRNKNDDSTELITCSNDESDVCSCFRTVTNEPDCDDGKSNTDHACSSLLARTSHSLSSILCSVNNVVSSLALKTESADDVCRFPSLGASAIGNDYVCDGTVCTESDFDANQIETQINAYQISPRVGNLTQELYKLSKYGWYWGPINRSEAESKLIDQPDGAFLVRDSSDDRYILSLSFRSYGKTLHTRIEHSHGMFSFYSQPEPEGHPSIVELIKQSMCYSQSGVFCYSRSRSPGSPSFPVRLTKPISRFTQIRSLQYLCRFVIRQYTRYDHIQKLPLPPRIKGYLEEGHY